MEKNLLNLKAEKTKNLLIAVLLISIAVFSRLIPHAWNFTTVGAGALLAGYALSPGLRFAVPLLSLVISDYVLGMSHDSTWVYLGFCSMIFVGAQLTKKFSWKKFVPTTLLASLLFFLISNFGVWLSGQLYPQSFAGLMQCYYMGLPFFFNQITADMIFSGVFFYAYMALSGKKFNLNFLPVLTEKK